MFRIAKNAGYFIAPDHHRLATQRNGLRWSHHDGDLDMGAILNGYRLEDTIRLAIAAGNDIAMICHRIPEIENVHRILGTLPRDQIDRAFASVGRFKKK